jgi:predicted transcriptional regulator
MTLRQILILVEGQLLTPGMNLETECSKVFASDLMSDVLAFMDPGSVLLTGLANSHVVRTACLVDIKAIIIVQGKRPDREVVDEAKQNNLPVISTPFSMFEACSRISRSFPEGNR